MFNMVKLVLGPQLVGEREITKMKLFFNKEGKFKYELNRMKLREEDAIPK